MEGIGIPDPNGIAKIGEATTGFIGAVNRFFPGISLRSFQKANSRTTDLILEDLEKIGKKGQALGFSNTLIQELQSDAIKRHRRAVNLTGVLEYAKGEINDDVDVSNVSDDWLESFQDHAEKVSDPDGQVIWGKLLAGEINCPGKYSKRLMSVISDMSTADAQNFTALCSLSIQSVISRSSDGTILIDPKPVALFFEDDNTGTFNEGAFSYNRRMALEVFGLIDSSICNCFIINPGRESVFLVMGKIARFKNNGDSSVKLSFSPVFTEIGIELASLCNGIGSSKSLEIALNKTAKEMGLELIV